MKVQEKMQKFLEAVDDHGDMYLPSGRTKTDVQQIEAIIEHQGYWAGVSNRFYFDKEFNLLKVEERRFGR